MDGGFESLNIRQKKKIAFILHIDIKGSSLLVGLKYPPVMSHPIPPPSSFSLSLSLSLSLFLSLVHTFL